MSEQSLAQSAQLTREERLRAIKERATRGLLLHNAGAVQRLVGDEWMVEGSDGQVYRVDLGEGSCTCPDHEHFGQEHDIACKHRAAVSIGLATRRGQVCEHRVAHAAAGDPFLWAGRRIEEAKLGLRERRTEGELAEAIAEEEDRRGYSMSHGERVAFAYGFFAPEYRAEISRLAALGVEGLEDEE
jgi:uncharacterized Zn finger protein